MIILGSFWHIENGEPLTADKVKKIKDERLSADLILRRCKGLKERLQPLLAEAWDKTSAHINDYVFYSPATKACPWILEQVLDNNYYAHSPVAVAATASATTTAGSHQEPTNETNKP